MALVDLTPVLADINRSYGRPALVAGVTDGQHLWAVGATGVRRLGDATPVTTSDPFHIGSVAKGMTANVISLLVERGSLEWTTPVGDILPGTSAMHPQMRVATVASLVSHRSGLAGYSTSAADWEPFTGWSGTPSEQRGRLAAHVLAGPPAVPPGEGLYSNAAYTVLAAIAERVADRPWEDLLRSTVLTPLGMDSAGFGWPVYAMSGAPIGHFEGDDGFEVADRELTFYALQVLLPAQEQAIVLMANAGDDKALMHGPVLQALTDHLTRAARNG